MNGHTGPELELAFVATHVAHSRSPIFREWWYNRSLRLVARIILIDRFQRVQPHLFFSPCNVSLIFASYRAVETVCMRQQTNKVRTVLAHARSSGFQSFPTTVLQG